MKLSNFGKKGVKRQLTTRSDSERIIKIHPEMIFLRYGKSHAKKIGGACRSLSSTQNKRGVILINLTS